MDGVPDTGGRRRWSTEGVDPGQALAYWIDTVCDRFLALDIDTPVARSFSATLDQVELGVTTANFIQAARQRVCRTPAKIARSGDGEQPAYPSPR